VIFRKVTGGFRSQWGARTYADALSVIATGRLHNIPLSTPSVTPLPAVLSSFHRD
jgi:hypothetical protein